MIFGSLNNSQFQNSLESPGKSIHQKDQDERETDIKLIFFRGSVPLFGVVVRNVILI